MQKLELTVALLACTLCLPPSSKANTEHSNLSAKIWRTTNNARPLLTIPIDKDPSQEKLSADQSQKIDDQITSIMRRWQIPGAEIAISNGAKVVLVHSYGFAELETNRPVHCHDLFRIASVSKCITALAVGKLIEDGRLNLDDHLADLLPELFQSLPPEHDERLKKITVADLLNMTAGWDRDKRGEVLFAPQILRTARKYETLCTPDLDTVCRAEFSKPLEHDPGTEFSYSNFSYALLGKIIEQKSKQDYTEFCREKLLSPLSLNQIQAAKRLPETLLENEVHYYPEGLTPKKKSMFSQDMDIKLAAPYGRIDIERYPQSFGWLSNAESLLTFCTNTSMLSKATLSKLYARPAASTWKKSKTYFASGWEFSNDYSTGSAVLFKDGTLSGSRAFVIQYPDGIACAALFNARPKYRKGDPFMQAVRSLFDEIHNSSFARTQSRSNDYLQQSARQLAKIASSPD